MTEPQKSLGLKIVFMGSSFIAEKVLAALIEKKHNIQAVITKAGKETPQGNPNPVKVLSDKHGIPLMQPEKFDDETMRKIKSIKPDLIIVAAYGKIIPKQVLEIPAFGAINFHPSLLPKWRGPSPVQNAILNGEKETGITIMLMNEGVDSGDILAQEKIEIGDNDNAMDLYNKLLPVGTELLLNTLAQWTERKIQASPQDNNQATYCQLIEREDGHIVWDQTTAEIYNRFRALNPWPGVFSFWDNGGSLVRIKFHSMLPSLDIASSEDQKSGEVIKAGENLAIRTVDGAIIINELQLEGKKPMNAQEFLNGYSAIIGSQLK